MNLDLFRQELTDFYWHQVDERAAAFCDRIFAILDQKVTDDMDGYERKALQYRTIAEHCQPVLFSSSPFYHELGAMSAHCDGAGDFRGILHAGGWNYARYQHMFAEQDPVLWQEQCRQDGAKLYLICGPYCDTRQHFVFNCKPIYKGGLKGMYEEAQAQLAQASA